MPESLSLEAEETSYDDGRVGVYIHLPFCERICPYCDFAVVAARPLEPEREARYTAGVLAELEARRPEFEGRRLASLYFGGGTPSLFSPDSIARLCEAVRGAFSMSGDRGASDGSDGTGGELETTLELNPSTTETERLPGFRDAGINRLSIGIQSFDDLQLKRLGRAHGSALAHHTLAAARRAGFGNLSLDLIFGGPGQMLEDLERDLEALLAFGPEHVSTYELTYEPETPFGRALARGKMQAPDEDRTIAMIGAIETRLGAAGFERYEISSYAKPGYRARHNSRYWQRLPVLGLGMGAHSTEVRSPMHPHGARRANPRTLDAWLGAVERGQFVGEIETLSTPTARGEAVFLALRQREGLSAARFEAEFGARPRAFFSPQIEALVGRGWLIEGDPAPGDLRLSAEGRLLADSVAAEFVAEAD